MISNTETAYYAMGIWKGLIDCTWGISDLKDMGHALFSKKTLKNLLDGSKRDKEICTVMMKNLTHAVGIMINYVEEQKVKAEAKASEVKASEVKASEVVTPEVKAAP